MGGVNSLTVQSSSNSFYVPLRIGRQHPGNERTTRNEQVRANLPHSTFSLAPEIVGALLAARHHPLCVAGFQVGRAILSEERSLISACFAASVCPLQHVKPHSLTALKANGPGPAHRSAKTRKPPLPSSTKSLRLPPRQARPRLKMIEQIGALCSAKMTISLDLL
jgi:hypothetical protein